MASETSARRHIGERLGEQILAPCVALLFLSTHAVAGAEHEEIMRLCKMKWPADNAMEESCREKQTEAIAQSESMTNAFLTAGGNREILVQSMKECYERWTVTEVNVVDRVMWSLCVNQELEAAKHVGN